MTEIKTANTAAATSSTEPAERKLPAGVVPVEGDFPGRVVTMTEPTKGLIWGQPGHYGTVFLGFGAAAGDSPAVFCQHAEDPAHFAHMLRYRQRLHILTIPEGVEYGDYYSNELLPTINDNPWIGHQWFRENLTRWAEHLPRPSKTVPGLLAYFQTPEKRARNIRTPIKPGKYLQKFFADLLTQEEIHELGLEWSNHFALRKLTITQDADEIERVYRGRHNGSCMYFGSGDYAGSEHPARAYAGPDLGIAYIGEENNADARCLVWPEKKIYYPKWYGDGPRLEAALEAQGYKVGDEDDFNGARMQRIEYGDGFVVPYVDVCEYARDDGRYLILGDSMDVYLRNTSGISFEAHHCARCGDAVSEYGVTTVNDGESVCDHCLSKHYFFCEGYEEYFPEGDRADTPEGTSYSYQYVRNHGFFFYCPETDLYYPEASYDEVTLVEGGTCVSTHAEDNGFYCEYHEEWSLEVDNKLTLSDGSTIHDAALEDGDYLTDWLERQGATLGTIPHINQLDMLEAA